MKNIYTFLYLIFLTNFSYSQVPVQYYDFENNSNRSTGELTPEIIINSAAGSTLSSAGGTLSASSGNPSSGSAQQRNDWDENGLTDPGSSASDYFEFNVNTNGFEGITVIFDAQGSIALTGPAGNINILYSADGGSGFTASTPQELTTSFDSYTWDLSAETGLDNNSLVTFRIYAYGDLTGTGTLAIDNLQITANRIAASKTLGDYQSIDDANGAAPFPEFTNLEIDGSGIEVTLSSDLIINNNLILTTGKIVTNLYEVKLTASAAVTSYGENSYVIGNFTNSWLASDDGTRFYPVGSAGFYRPAELTAFSVTANGSITVRMNETSPGSTSLPPGVDIISSIRYWIVTLTDGMSFHPDFGLLGVKLFWGSNDGVTDASSVIVARGTAGGVWTEQSNTGFNSSEGWVLGSFADPASGDFTFGNTGSNPLPVELSTFTAEAKGNNVLLNWKTETEINSYSFNIERQKVDSPQSSVSSKEHEWTQVGSITASGNSNTSRIYSFTDENLSEGRYQYRLKMIDNDGSFNYSDIAEASFMKPGKFKLMQNYPNPFNPVTNIEYQIPENGFVTVKVFDILGNEIKVLVNEFKESGTYSERFDAAGLSSGIYIYSIKWDDKIYVKNMLLIK